MKRRNPASTVLVILAALIFSVSGAFAMDAPAAATLDKTDAARRAEALMDGKHWQEAAAVLDKALLTASEYHDLHLMRGRCALGLMALSEAGEHFARALSLSTGLEGAVALGWRDAALQALEEDKLDRAVAMFAKAFYHDRALGDELGALTIGAAQEVTDEDKRAGYLTRAVAWTGTRPVIEASIAHYSRTFGPPLKIYLENPGWVDVARLNPGDELLYLSEKQFQQRDDATIRIVPVAVTQPMKLTVTERDTKDAADTLIRVARHQLPTSAYIWLLPGTNK